MLGPHQQVGAALRPPLREQGRDVALAVHHRDGAGAAKRRRQPRAVAPSPQPARGFALLRRLAAVRLSVGAVELDARNAERDARLAHREGAVHVDPEGARGVPVARDVAQALASGMGREIQIRPVLDQQDRLRAAHPAQRPLAVRGQNRLRREFRAVGPLHHPVVLRDRRAVPARGSEKRLRRQRGLDPDALDQPLGQSAAEGAAAEFILRPARHVKALAGAEDPRGRRGRPDSRAPRRPAPRASRPPAAASRSTSAAPAALSSRRS